MIIHVCDNISVLQYIDKDSIDSIYEAIDNLIDSEDSFTQRLKYLCLKDIIKEYVKNEM